MVPNIRHHSVRGKAALGKATECNGMGGDALIPSLKTFN